MEAGKHDRWATHRARAPWPYAALDVPALRAGGRLARPLRQFVVKTNSRCNLACTYCYVYEMADGSWRDRPAVISAEVRALTVRRIADHARRHRLPSVDLVLHGGEPLLTPAAELAAFVEELRAALPTGCALSATVQTNATLLTAERLDALAAAGIRVGVSLDGGPGHNGRRVDHAGRPSWPAAARGLRLLAERPESYAGLLCVVDLEQDPVETYESLLSFAPPAIDLLLPLGNWSSPPPGRRPGRTPYADWLIAVFDHWWDAGRRRTRIRRFEEVIALLFGLPTGTEALGLAAAVTAVVETDGSIELIDTLKSAYDGAADTGLHVARDGFDALLDHPGFAARQLGPAALAPVCQACDLVTVCGGGHYVHRFRDGDGFRNPSVYCTELDALIRHIAGRLRAAVPERPAPDADPWAGALPC
ncbi:FxsB family cyclophane-forming radical SAM/SPASM peptide maturase [Streptomyces justiciae]|uniref:FxsB family cyclophane-forming radical SAM/SPASM peptide maturase n=1 Tax=Streptomyces justiciae TaxID=2780140 RepID=UPI00211844AC|nr:FxsB family cyclophane-forming radical SAM/SPASM peptide maturase [Streptomyces justiciae]MCW8381515.1 FxsB family radical SAM/SPASM domain protein [Streptomyces justiciae]